MNRLNPPITGGRERGVDAGMIAISASDPIGRDRAEARGPEWFDEIAVEESPGWIAGKQQHRGRGAIALVDERHVPAVHEPGLLFVRKNFA